MHHGRDTSVGYPRGSHVYVETRLMLFLGYKNIVVKIKKKDNIVGRYETDLLTRDLNIEFKVRENEIFLINDNSEKEITRD